MGQHQQTNVSLFGSPCGVQAHTILLTIKWPDEVEKEKAKDWVQGFSCPEWRDGWLMVDGTFVPLFQRPHGMITKATTP
jgi:hypothetical protein